MWTFITIPYQKRPVKIAADGNKIFFESHDICAALIPDTSPTKACRRVDQDKKFKLTWAAADQVEPNTVILSLDGVRQLFASVGAVHQIPFEIWVAVEVLPAVRAAGCCPPASLSADMRLLAATANQALSEMRLAKQEHSIVTRKAELLDYIGEWGNISISRAAGIMGVPHRMIFDYLVAQKVIVRANPGWAATRFSENYLAVSHVSTRSHGASRRSHVRLTVAGIAKVFKAFLPEMKQRWMS